MSGAYQAPMLTDDEDDFDVDLAALVDANENIQGTDSPAEEEISTEAMCAQIMDGIEWEDEDDEDEWLHQQWSAHKLRRHSAKSRARRRRST